MVTESKKGQAKDVDVEQEVATEREKDLLHIIRESEHSEKLIIHARSLISQLEYGRRKE